MLSWWLDIYLEMHSLPGKLPASLSLHDRLNFEGFNQVGFPKMGVAFNSKDIGSNLGPSNIHLKYSNLHDHLKCSEPDTCT